MTSRGFFRRFVAGALCALLFCLFSDPGAAAGLATSSLTITAQSGGERRFTVEVAADEATRETGLMNRRVVPEGEGMLFVFPKPKPVMMWMKDTLVSLDMLFIDKRGRVIGIAENTTPMDETIIASPGDAGYVLELAGGEAHRLGLAKGDQASGPALAFKAAD